MLFTLFLTALQLAFNVQAQQNGTTVQTQQGPVTGKLVSSSVRRFLGIPYAVAERWEAPGPPPSRSATLEAINYGDSCVQALSASAKEFLNLVGLGGQNVQESENCLTANIWAPSQGRKQGTAVMIWMYGGGFQFGTSNTVYYDAENLVRDNDDVLVVTFNYRLNIFGQPNAPQLFGGSQTQNFFFLDAKAVIDWVYSNIAAFGGDPERITIFGESAGSGIADVYAYAFPTDTKVKGIIEQSGSAAGVVNPAPPPSNASSLVAWNQVASVVGCGNDTTSEQFSCMKAVPFRKLEDAVMSTGAAFGPIPDDIVFFSDTNARSAAGKFLHVPLLVGNNAQEFDIFLVEVQELDIGFVIPGVTQVVSDTLTQLAFACSAGVTAGGRAKAGVPTWRYRYEGVFPDLTSRPELRAYHSSEIPIVFGTYNSSTLPGAPTGHEIALSKYVQGAWVAFARDPQQGLLHYGWPKYDPNTASVAVLGNFFNQSGVVFTPGALLDATCGLLGGTFTLLTEIVSILGGIISLL